MKFERIKFEEIPNDVPKYIIKDWFEMVESGGFIDYDGFGYLATKDKMSNLLVYPSFVENSKITKVRIDFDFDIPYEEDWKFTHIVWFNR